MNKSQLVDALADHLGDRRTAAAAVDTLLQIVVDTVRSGDSVSLPGFGVFESRARAARTGRNPRTGEAVEVPATTVPAFRPGTGFRTAVAGTAVAGTAPAVATGRRTRAAAVTNGAGGDTAGATLSGAGALEAPVLADGDAAAPKGKKKAGKKAATDDTGAKDKAKKKGKKGKK